MTNQSTSVNPNEPLRLGIEAARANKFPVARKYLTQALQQQSNSLPAMFWMAFVAPSPQESVYWLERILALDPDNARATAGLQWAKKRLKAEETPKIMAGRAQASDIAPTRPAQAGESAPELPDAFIREQMMKTQKGRPRAKKSRWVRWSIAPLTVALVIVGVTFLLLLSELLPSDTLAAWWPVPANTTFGQPAAIANSETMMSFEPAEVEAAAKPGENYTSLADTIVIEPASAGVQGEPVEIESLTILPEMAPSEPLEQGILSLPQGASRSSGMMGAPPEVTAEFSLSEAPLPENSEISDASPELSESDTTMTVQTGTDPLNFMGPAEEILAGVRLFEPVDEALLVHQPASADEKWIQVNVTDQRVTAWEGNVPVMSFITSTGLPNTPTVLGEFNIYWKLESTLMVGDDYYLPEVPYTMYFYLGYALHGAYWHDNFGQPMSHGCVNLSIDNAKMLFEWADPVIPEGYTQVVASADNPGTLVVVHE